MEPEEPDGDSPDQIRAARADAQRRTLADLAGEIARTEDDVARVHEEIAAGPSTLAAEAKEQARKARAFAQHEREERDRWSLPDETGRSDPD